MMLKKMVLLFILLSGLLMACDSNDEVEQFNYEGEGNTWRAELEYQEEAQDDGQIQADLDLVISFNGPLGESELADEISFRLELEDAIVLEGSEDYDDTEDVSALYVTGESIIDNPLPAGTRIVLEVEWNGRTEEFQLDEVEDE